MQTTFDYCVRHGILGVGWRLQSERNTTRWDEYYTEASQYYDNLQICAYIHKRVTAGDLVWTRDPSGRYFLAKVLSGWEYWTSEESKEQDIDIGNIFRCDTKQVPIDDVPGKVVACFRGRRSIQEVADAKAREYTKHLWNVLSGQQIYKIDATTYSDIFMLLDDQETEDLVFLYLQSRGWFVVPHSRKADTMSFEYLCVNPVSGEIALTQVKTGEAFINREAPIDRQNYTDVVHKTFLFQPNGRYVGSETGSTETISREELLEFLQKSSSWLPGAFRHKMEIAGQ